MHTRGWPRSQVSEHYNGVKEASTLLDLIEGTRCKTTLITPMVPRPASLLDPTAEVCGPSVIDAFAPGSHNIGPALAGGNSDDRKTIGTRKREGTPTPRHGATERRGVKVTWEDCCSWDMDRGL